MHIQADFAPAVFFANFLLARRDGCVASRRCPGRVAGWEGRTKHVSGARKTGVNPQTGVEYKRKGSGKRKQGINPKTGREYAKRKGALTQTPQASQNKLRATNKCLGSSRLAVYDKTNVPVLWPKCLEHRPKGIYRVRICEGGQKIEIRELINGLF